MALKIDNAVNDFMDKHPAMKLAAIVLMIFPLLVSAAQWLAEGAIIPMSAGDMVQYYGTVGALCWAICAFVLQSEENKSFRVAEEKRLRLHYIPNFALEACLKDGAILFKITNIGVHGVRDLYVEDFFLCPYLASESEIALSVMTRPLKIDDLFSAKEADSVSSNSAEWGVSFSGKIGSDGFPREISLLAVDLLDRPWRQSFKHSQNGNTHIYFAEKPVGAES